MKTMKHHAHSRGFIFPSGLWARALIVVFTLSPVPGFVTKPPKQVTGQCLLKECFRHWFIRKPALCRVMGNCILWTANLTTSLVPWEEKKTKWTSTCPFFIMMLSSNCLLPKEGLFSSTSRFLYIRCSDCRQTRQPLLPCSTGEKKALQVQFMWPNSEVQYFVYFWLGWIRMCIWLLPKQTPSSLGNCSCLNVCFSNYFLEQF